MMLIRGAATAVVAVDRSTNIVKYGCVIICSRSSLKDKVSNRNI